MILDRSAFLTVESTDYGYVDIPEALPADKYAEWLESPESVEPPQVRVRSLMMDQRARLRARADQDDKLQTQSGSWNALCAAMGMVDDKGAYLFPNENEGATLLGKRHPELIERIASKILDISSMTKASREAIEKKSQRATNSSGHTSSPETSTPDLVSA
jgi:hypothetical protein